MANNHSLEEIFRAFANNSNNQNTTVQPDNNNLSYYNLTPDIIKLPILKPTGRFNLQNTLGLKRQKSRWNSYLDMMRDVINEKNIDFEKSYRQQKDLVAAQVIRLFKKKATDFPPTLGDWGIKEMLIKNIQRKRYNIKAKNTKNTPNILLPLQRDNTVDNPLPLPRDNMSDDDDDNDNDHEPSPQPESDTSKASTSKASTSGVANSPIHDEDTQGTQGTQDSLQTRTSKRANKGKNKENNSKPTRSTRVTKQKKR